MEFVLDISLTRTRKGVYQAEGRDGEGNVVGEHTFRYRTDLVAS